MHFSALGDLREYRITPEPIFFSLTRRFWEGGINPIIGLHTPRNLNLPLGAVAIQVRGFS